MHVRIFGLPPRVNETCAVWDTMLRRLVISYGRFRTTYWLYLQGSWFH